MSDLIILLLIIAPIALVVFILKSSKKKQKRRSQERLSAYVYEVTGQLGIKHSFRKQLVQQHLILDETSGKMVVIDHNKELSHEVYSLDHIRSLKVVSL